MVDGLEIVVKDLNAEIRGVEGVSDLRFDLCHRPGRVQVRKKYVYVKERDVWCCEEVES